MPKRFLITAGSTQEMIDEVRSWGSIFTGNTGLSIAKALANVGDVDLLTSNRVHLSELSGVQSTAHRINASGFTSHSDLRDQLAAKMRDNSYDAVFMSAAISDYKPQRVFSVISREPIAGKNGQERWIVEDVQAGKVKSNHPTIAVVGTQTEKLVDLFRKEWNYRGLLVKFKLEVGIKPEELIRIGQASRISSGADFLVANTLDMVEGPKAGAFLLSEVRSEWIPRGELAGRMARLVI